MSKQKLYLIIIILQVIAIVISAGTYFSKKDNMYSNAFLTSEFELTGGEIDENGILCINTKNASEGIVASLYLPELDKSGYDVVLSYNATSDNSYIYAENNELAEVMFESSKAYINTTSNNNELSFHMKANSGNTVIHVFYDGDGELNIDGLSVVQNTNIYKQNIFKALVLCLVGFFFIYLYNVDVKKRKIILGLVLVSVVASNLVYINYLISGHDLPFHLNRIEGIYVGLQNGDFPVKIQTPWLNGYGYPVGVFYGDVLLYIPAILRIFGFSIQGSYQIFVFIINLITTFISYYSFKRLFNSSNMGLAGATIYVLSLYRLENLYSRAAVGEYCAMIFLPMILVGMYEILSDKKDNKRLPAVLLFALGLSGVIHTHILSCVIVAFFILLTCVVFVKKVLKPSVFARLVLVVGLTLVFSLDFIVPFLDYYTLDFKVNSASWGTTYIQNMGMYFNQIFSLLLNPQVLGFEPPYGMTNEMTIGLGIVPLVGCVLYVYLLLSMDYKIKPFDYKLGLYSLIMFVLAVLFSTCYFPWDQLSYMNGWFETIIGIIQFPWRFLTVAVLFSTVFICIAMRELKNILPIGQQYIPTAFICISIAFTVGVYCNSLMLDEEYGKPIYIYEQYSLDFNQVYTGEYLPEGTEPELLTNNKIVTTENVKYENYSKNGSNIKCYVLSEGTNGYIEFPLLYYKGYIAKDNFADEKLEVIEGENNVVRIILPTDFEGEINLSFEEPFYWRIAELLTFIALSGVVVYWLTKEFLKLRIKRDERSCETK